LDPTPKQDKKRRGQLPDDPVLVDLLTRLNVVRKNIKLYPPGHPQLKTSMERMAEALSRHFVREPEFILSVTAEDIRVEGEPLEGHPAFGELAEYLHGKAIYELVFQRGVSAGDLLAFHLILEGDPSLMNEGESLTAAMERQGAGKIQVKVLDYDALAFTEEKEMAAADLGRLDPGGALEEMVSALLRGKGPPGPLAEGIRLTGADPAKLAVILDRLASPPDAPDLSFDRVAAKYFGELAEGGPDLVGDDRVKDSLLKLIQALGPSLRSEFLSKALSFSASWPELTAEVLCSLPVRMVLAAIGGLDTSSLEINPKILELLDFMASAGPFAGEDESMNDLAPGREERFKKEARALISTRKAETRHESASLEDLTEGLEEEVAQNRVLTEALARLEAPRKSADLAGDLAEAMAPALISAHCKAALLDLLEKAPGPEEAQACSARLVALVDETLAMGEWDEFLDTWEQAKKIKQRLHETKPFVGYYLDRAWGELFTVETLSHLSFIILKRGWEESARILDLLRASGSQAAQRLVDTLIEEENKSVRGIQLRLITELSEHTMPFVVNRLKDPHSRWFVIRNMLSILQRMGDPAAAPLAEEMAAHPHPKVSLEALRTLARLNHPRAGQWVVKALNDPDPEISAGAVSVASILNDPEVARALVAIITDKRRMAGAPDLARKQQAVRALALMRLPGTLVELFDFVSGRRLFSGAEFERLKLEIYRSLDAYPPSQELKDFIVAGLSEKNLEINEIARRLKAKIQKMMGSS